MAIKDLTRKVILKFEGDASNLKKALDSIQIETKETKADFVDMARDASKALDTIGLGAEAQVGRVGKLHDAFQSFTGKLGSGLQAVDGFAKALGPWNQALELGGKAVRFASDALDAYAKRSPEAAKRVREVKDAFDELKESAMAAAGWLVMDTLGGSGVGGKVDLSKFGAIVRAVEEAKYGKYYGGSNEAADPLQHLSDAYYGAKKTILAKGDQWNNTSVLDALGIGGDKRTDAEKKAAAEAAADRAARAILNGAIAAVDRNVKDVIPKFDASRIGLASSSGILGMKADSTSRDSYGNAIDESAIAQGALSRNLTNDWFERIGKREKQQNFLESHFGSVDDFDAYATAFGTLTSATDSAMQAWISGSMSVGDAIKKGIGGALAGLASQMAVESLKHGAYALGSLAFGDISGAARHGAAAAAFGAGAVAAAAAARSLGGGGSPTNGGGGGGGSGAAGGASYGNGSPNNGTGERIIVLMGDAQGRNSPRMEQMNAERVVDLAFGGEGVTSR